MARYRGHYDAGFDVLRRQRLQRQEELGIVAPGTVAHSTRLPGGGWDWLTAAQKQAAARNMEIYAAMVERLDRNVGKVIDGLKASGELDNTLILFLADNGAEGLDAETTGAALFKDRLAGADNSLANRGRPSSYVTYGPGWAQAATAPSWAVKGYATEGGTRTVSFLNWSGLGARAGTIDRTFLTVADIAPTLLEIAGAKVDPAKFAGRTVQPITGRSWLPWLTGKADRVHPADEAVGEELFGSRSIRQGDWKITDPGDGVWRLFNLAADPGETTDLSAGQPERLKALTAAWDAYARDQNLILPNEVTYRP